MFVRITEYKMKAGSRDAAMEIMERVKGDILAMPGIHQFVNGMDDDGSGHIVVLSESRETSEANASRVKEIWANFADLLESAPTMVGHDVIANWSP